VNKENFKKSAAYLIKIIALFLLVQVLVYVAELIVVDNDTLILVKKTIFGLFFVAFILVFLKWVESHKKIK
jgi:hypothetical protein